MNHARITIQCIPKDTFRPHIYVRPLVTDRNREFRLQILREEVSIRVTGVLDVYTNTFACRYWSTEREYGTPPNTDAWSLDYREPH